MQESPHHMSFIFSRMQLTLHATRPTPHGAWHLVLAMSAAWSVKTRRAPSWHCRDARVYGHATTAMHDMSTPPHPRPPATQIYLKHMEGCPAEAIMISEANMVSADQIEEECRDMIRHWAMAGVENAAMCRSMAARFAPLELGPTALRKASGTEGSGSSPWGARTPARLQELHMLHRWRCR